MRGMSLISKVFWAASLGSCASVSVPSVQPETRGATVTACPFSTPGVVVERILPESPGARAGLMPGDRLFSWCRVPEGGGECIARGDLRTPYDWLDLDLDDIQRGGVVIHGERGAEKLRWALLPAAQFVLVAPLLSGALAEAYQSSLDHRKADDLASAAEELERAAELADRSPCADAAIWLRARAADQRGRARQWPEMDAGYESALAKARALGATRAEANILLGWAELLSGRGDMARAVQQLERALALEEKDHPENLRAVTVLFRLGNAANQQDDAEEAERLYRRAYALILRAAPGSSFESAATNNLAMIEHRRGNLAQAEFFAARAVAVQEKLTPSGEPLINRLLTYGNVIYTRGDFAGAEAAFLRAKKILENVYPESPSLASTLDHLGTIAYERGDHDAAEDLFRRALVLYEKLDPSGREALDSLAGFGEAALRQGQGEKAEEWWRRALAASTKYNSGPKQAWSLRGLAEAARLQGRQAEAEELLRQALAVWQDIYPEALETGLIHLSLGLLLLEQEKTEDAESHLRAAIGIHAREGRSFPEGHQALARLQVQRGRREEAAASYLAAFEALEAQRMRLGGAPESQWLYGSSLGDLYFEAAENQIALARPREAWELIERGRARGFQEVLAQRDLRFAAELPADLYAESRRLAAEYDRTQAALAAWEPAQGAGELEKLESRLRDLRLEQAASQERIRQASPRLRDLASPVPLDLAAARSALDPGTVLLTYSVGASRSYLFVIEADGVPGPGLSFYQLAIGREDLQKEIETFRGLLGRPDTLLAAVQQRGRDLYDLLVRPAEPALARADRWLISSDGPLHVLPFAALRAGDQYLAERKPIHVAASATVYKEIQATRPEKPAVAAMEMLAVGDPLYPAGLAARDETDPQVQTALRRGFRLEPLPATRSEVEAIANLFPQGTTLLGRDATEETIKSLAPRARRLHFACHGLLDERFPLNSGLALSIPERPEAGRDNGLLQAWEVFEEVRLSADLVTLSACDSGLGQEMGGEGLVGLVRAFQFAGARSVLASMWSVSDASTAVLMKGFYTYLRQGKPKDEALQAAQLDLIHAQQGELSHPYNWAGFSLHGDWK